MYTCVTGSSSQRTRLAHLSQLSLVLTYQVHKMFYGFIYTLCNFYSHVDYYNTSETVIIPTKKPVISEDNAMPTYAYYIIGIGSAVLMIALGFLVGIITVSLVL